MEKENITIMFLLVMITLIILPQVSAQFFYVDLRQGTQQIIDQGTDLIAPIFEIILGDYQGSEFFFTKILVLIILYIMIFSILKKVPLFEDNPTIAGIVAIAVSTIGVRFISENSLIWGIILPYSTLAIVLTTILPFLIFVYFIYTTEMPGLGRKACWIFFAVVFIVLWVYRSDQMSPLGNQIYLWTIIVMFGFLIFDKRVAAYFRGQDIKDFESNAHIHEINDLQARLNYLITNAGPSPSKTNIAERKQILRRLRKLGAGAGRGDYLP